MRDEGIGWVDRRTDRIVCVTVCAGVAVGGWGLALNLRLAELVERPEKTVRQASLVAGEFRKSLAAVAADRRADQEGLGFCATVG